MRAQHENLGTSSESQWPWSAIAFGALCLVAIALRVRALYADPLIGDELFSRNIAARSLGDAIASMSRDVHPPLYYLLLKLWVALCGTTPLALRSLSVVFSIATVAMTYRLGRRLYASPWAATLAAGAVALSDPQILYAHVARSYSLYAFLVVWMLDALFGALRDERPSRWVAFGASATAVMYTHYVGALFVLATFPAVYFAPQRRARARWFASVGAASLALAPWVLVSYFAVGRLDGVRASIGWIVTPDVRNLAWVTSRWLGAPPLEFGVTFVLTVVGLASCAYVVARRRGYVASAELQRSLAILVGPCVLVALALFALASAPIRAPIWGLRHLLPAQAPWMLLAVAAVLELGRRSRAALTGAAAMLVALQVWPTATSLAAPRFGPIDRAARFLLERNVGGEPVLCSAPHSVGLPLGFYLGAELPVPGLRAPSELPPRFWLVARPWVRPEGRALDGLVGAGWRVDERVEFSREAGDAHPVLAVHLVR